MNDDASPTRAVPASDWQVLQALFSDDGTGFHHHMGLVRANTREFYASTENGESLLAERAMILSSPDADRYIIDLSAGAQALEEFIGVVAGGKTNDDVSPHSSIHRSLGLRLEPDWLLLSPPEWRVVAACVCFPTRWSLEGKALGRLTDIHGVVPQLNEELGRKIETFFSKVKPGEGWGRANWGLSSSVRLNQHPSLPCEPLCADQSFERIQIRVERQHLCKLPQTGAMSFGIRVVNYPLPEVLQRPSVLAGLKQRLRTMPPEIARYKSIPPDLWRRF